MFSVQDSSYLHLRDFDVLLILVFNLILCISLLICSIGNSNSIRNCLLICIAASLIGLKRESFLLANKNLRCLKSLCKRDNSANSSGVGATTAAIPFLQ